ncbi:unnamed protein product [Effrenium voratum]|uniref:Uncharacterized protein n=1 Tax=Effrenium voratum TaxID=2562239 RepID=A0AA36MKU9_9DINO|nr:unnamed protein product [Effrenium voratum]
MGRLAPVLDFPQALVVSTAPLVYLKFLQTLHRSVSRVSRHHAEGLGNLLKFVGATCFAVGHGLQCLHKGSAEYTDWGYILACTPCLNLAFGGALLGRPYPSALLASGLLLHVAYDPLLLRAWRAGAEKLLPGIGVAAAMLLTWLGTVATLLEHSVLSSSPLLPVPVYAMMTCCSFGLGNSVKLQRLLSAKEACNKAFLGQVLKVFASSLLLTGNGLGLGWHKLRVRRHAWMCSVVLAACLRTFAAKAAEKQQKQTEKCQ